MERNREIVLTRWFATSPDAIFDAFVNPAVLTRWMGPRGSRVVECSVEPRPRGRFRFGLEFDGGMVIVLTGTYRAIESPVRLAFSWGIEGQDDDSEVTVQLSAVRGGTALLLTHRGLTVEELAQNEAGWVELFDRLGEALGVDSESK